MIDAAERSTPEVELLPNSPEWLEARRHGLGGSDAAAILGLSRWKSPYSLWLNKTGQTPEGVQHEAALWGHLLESPVKNEYSRRLARQIGPGVVMQKYADWPVLFANTDGAIVECSPYFPAPASGAGIYEGKTCSAYYSHEWKNGVPLYYEVQVQQYLAVMGLDWAGVACLVGGNRLVTFDVLRDDRFIRNYLRVAKAFWARVESGDPPPIDPSPATEAALDSLWQRTGQPGRVIDLDWEGTMLAHELVDVNEQIKRLMERKRQLVTLMKGAMGTAEFGVLPDGRAAKHYDGGSARVLKQLPREVMKRR